MRKMMRRTNEMRKNENHGFYSPYNRNDDEIFHFLRYSNIDGGNSKCASEKEYILFIWKRDDGEDLLTIHSLRWCAKTHR